MPAFARLLPRRRGRSRGHRRTWQLAGLAASATAALAAAELLHVWRRGHAAEAARGGHVLAGGRAAARDTVAVIREGYRLSSANETALLLLFLAFGTTFGGARAVTAMIRHGIGPLANVRIGDRHIHHFVPGILLAFLAGGTSIVVRHEGPDKWLAVPFGAGAALVLDESALLLELEDVYWSEEGVVSVQIGLGASALLAALALIVRMVRRGERRVLAPER